MKHKKQIDAAEQKFNAWYTKFMVTSPITQLPEEVEQLVHEYMHMAFIFGCIAGVEAYEEVVDENLLSLNEGKWKG